MQVRPQYLIALFMLKKQIYLTVRPGTYLTALDTECIIRWPDNESVRVLQHLYTALKANIEYGKEETYILSPHLCPFCVRHNILSFVGREEVGCLVCSYRHNHNGVCTNYQSHFQTEVLPIVRSMTPLS